MATEYRKRARSPTPESDLSDGEWPVPFGSPLGSPVDAVPGGEDNEASRPAPKYHRAPSPEREYLCTLPPTCAQPGTSQRFATQAALDAHQVRLHRWVCRVAVRDKPGRVGEGAQIVLPDGVPAALALPEHFSGRNPGGRGKGQKWRECGKIFPDGRLLDLHEAETHDPLARERMERGEKIFACFLPPEQCGLLFATPKKRRWHLVNVHHYPKEYFFAVTNHGLNQLTRTDGLGASLIRPRRDVPAPMAVDEAESMAKAEEEARQGQGQAPTEQSARSQSGHDHSHVHGHGHGHGPTHAYGHHGHPTARGGLLHQHAPVRPPDSDGDIVMDALTASMAGLESSLSFVPRNVARRARQRETRG